MSDTTLHRLAELARAAKEATPGQRYARGRYLSRVPDNSGMGATLPTNHIANFAEREDCEFAAAASPDVVISLLARIAALEEGLREALDLHPPYVEHLEALLKASP